MNNPILSIDETLTQLVKKRLEELETCFGAQEVFCLLTNSLDRTVICKKGAEQTIEFAYLKSIYELTLNPTVRIEAQLKRTKVLPVEHAYVVDKDKFYVIPMLVRQRDSIMQTAHLGLQFKHPVEASYVKYYTERINSILEELERYLELMFLKSDNTSRMYWFMDVFAELAGNLSTRLPYHMNNVATWSLELARKLNLNEEDLMKLYFAALAHDVGMLYTDYVSMNKTTPLSDKEYQKIKEHPEKGEKLFKLFSYGVPSFDEIPRLIRHHHERWDGKGYPDNLEGNQIPYLSQIISIADAVDSMLAERPFATSKSVHEVKRELENGAGIQYNPELVAQMVLLLDHKSINVENSFVFNEIMVIHNAAICVTLQDSEDEINTQGSLNINGGKARIVLKEPIEVKSERVKEIKIAFFDRKKFFEFSVVAGELDGNTILVENLCQIPGDRLFCLYWDIPVELLIDDGISMKALRVGGENLAVQLSTKEIDSRARNELLQRMGSKVKLKLRFPLEETETVLIDTVIKGWYQSGEKYVFQFQYENLPHEVVDRIVRLLFRKQMYDGRNLK